MRPRLAPIPLVVAMLALLGGHAWLAAADAPPGPVSSPAPRVGNTLSLDDLFAALDKDGDGRLAKAEVTGTYAPRFAQWDANGDGVATREEVRAFRQRLGIADNGLRMAAPPVANGAPARKAGDGGGGAPRRAATAASAVVLLEPTDWRLETMAVPPGFARDIALKGSEEIRFSPGMFDPTAAGYFTCVLAVVVEGEREIGAAEVTDFLEKYYRGLSVGMGRPKGLTPNPEEMRARVVPRDGAAEAKDRIDAEVVFFDTFSDGRKITLHVEAQIIPQPTQQKTCLVLLVSPSTKEKPVWQKLREIGEKAAVTARGR